MTRALASYLSRGMRGLVSDIEATNYASAGCRPSGFEIVSDEPSRDL